MDAVTVEQHLFDTTAIARRLGVYSKRGLPHNKAISAIISVVGCGDDEEAAVLSKDTAIGHAGVALQYAESVVQRVKLWLERNAYPELIAGHDRNFRVTYKRDIADDA